MEEESNINIESKNPRASRSMELRGFKEGRVKDERPPIVFGLGSRFNLPPQLVQRFKDDGYVLSWVVYSSGGSDHKENYYEAIDKGYQPLPASAAPELMRQYELTPFGDGKREEASNQLIQKGGQTLMKRPIEIHNAEEDFYDSENQRQQYMSDLYRAGQANPSLPRPFLDESQKRV